VETFKHCASVLFADKTAEIFYSRISQRDDTGWKMSILLPESTAIFLLVKVKGPVNKLVFSLKISLKKRTIRRIMLAGYYIFRIVESN